MSKVQIIKDLNMNYDYSTVLMKKHIPEEVKTLPLGMLESFIVDQGEESKFYCLTGKLFDEDTVMVDDIDRLVELFNRFEDKIFIIAPLEELEDMSWYNIVNWPDHVKLLAGKDNAYKSYDEEAVFYTGELETSVLDLGYKLFNINKLFEESFGGFIAKTYENQERENYLSVDLENGHTETDAYKGLRLKLIEVKVASDSTIEGLVSEITSLKEDGLCFYKVVLSGLVDKEQSEDFEQVLFEALPEEMEIVIDNRTFKDYPVESIKKNNKDNLIGIFIKNVEESKGTKEEKQRIIETGLDYLL